MHEINTILRMGHRETADKHLRLAALIIVLSVYHRLANCPLFPLQTY
jgi:hypothetical protein